MLLNKNTPRQNYLSTFYGKCKEAFAIKQTAKFWFGSLMSAAQQIQPSGIIINISKNQFNELLFILNQATTDLIAFYPKNPPQEVYRLLHISKTIIDLNPREGQNFGMSFQSIMYKVHFNTNLALFLVKNSQYSAAYECFQYVTQILKSEIVDTRYDIFLANISNYLTFIKTYQYSQANRKMAQLLHLLQQTFQSLLDKYITNGCSEPSILLILSIFKQHEIYFNKHFAAQIKLLIKKYQEGRKQANGNTIQNTKMQNILQRNKIYWITNIQIKRKQLNFFTIPSHLHKTIYNNQKKLKPQQKANNRSIVQQVDLSLRATDLSYQLSSPPILSDRNEASALSKKQNKPQIDKTIQYHDTKKILKPIVDKSNQKQRIQQKIRIGVDQHKKIYNKNEAICVKVNYSVLQILSQGVIISDFLKEKRRFLTWHQVFAIIKHLKFNSTFACCLPVANFYDVYKILSNYIYRNDTQQKGTAILDIPKELVQLNMPVKLFHIGGKYLKAFIMNQYDMTYIQLCIECYLAEFEKQFKMVTQDEYIQHLNNKIFRKQAQDPKVYNIENWKKKETTIQSLSNIFKFNQLQQIPFLKACPFRIVLYMPNNKQILVKYYERQNRQQQNIDNLQLQVIGLHTEDKKINKLNIPFYKLNKYFAANQSEIGNWLKKHGKIVVQAYSQSFRDYPFSFNNLQHFDITVYAKKIQMMKIGKYVSPVTAQIIGSKTRVWGLCIRYFEITNIKEYSTFIYNPYYNLLTPLIKEKPELRKSLLIQLLFQGSVTKTHKKLTESKMSGKLINLFDYWNLIDF